MIHEIVVPQLGVNDETITVVEWRVKDKEKVGIDAPLCLVETSKATTELTAEYAGFVRIKTRAGEEAKIKEAIGYITDSADTEIEGLKADKQSSVKATKKAIDLARKLGIDIDSIGPLKGIIREKDVQKFYDDKIKNKDKDVD